MSVRILAFAGSTRTESFNKKLVRIAVQHARDAGADVTHVDLRDLAMPLYDGDLEATQGEPENARKLKDLFRANDALLMSCPEYNSSVSGVWKNAIDWVSRTAPGEKPLECFQGKVVGQLSASPGAFGGVRSALQVRSILQHVGCIVIPDQVNLMHADQAFEADGRLKDPKVDARVRGVALALIEATRKLKG